MYVWVFFWTPALATEETKHAVPYGIVFACYMAAFMIGGSLPQYISMDRLPYGLHTTALVVTGVATVFYDAKLLVFFSFVIFEGTVGSYFPTHGTIRSKAIDETTRAAVMNLFRVPLNLYVVLLLQIKWTTQEALGVLVFTHLFSVGCLAMFRATPATHHGEHITV